MVASAPTLFGAGGGSLFARSVLGATSGAGVGAADVAVRGGDPVTGGLFGAGGGAAGVMVGGLLGRAFARRGATPTAQALKQQGGPLFDRARALGLMVRGEPYRGVVTKLATKLQAEGIDPVLYPKASRAMTLIEDSAKRGELDLVELSKARDWAGSAAASLEGKEARLGEIMIDALDDFMDGLSAAHVTAGDSKAVNMILRQARDLWTKARRVEVIEQALDKAELTIARGRADPAVTIKGQFARIATNRKLLKKFTAEQQKAIRAVAKETSLAGILERVGGLRGTIVGVGAGLGIDFLAGIPGGGAVTGAAVAGGLGSVGRRTAEAGTRRAAERALGMAATGTLPALTPSARARAFGQAATFGAGLQVGREGVER